MKDRTANIPVYCINLARSRKRRDYMVQEFRELGWRAKFIEAIDGDRLDRNALLEASVLSKDNQGLFGGPMSTGEIACHLSHERAWRTLRRSGSAYALICEDDNRFRRPAVDLPDLVIALPRQADVLYLHYMDGEGQERIAPPFDARDATPAAQVGPHAIYPAWSCGGATCYVLSVAGAAKLLDAARPMRFPVDGQLGRLAYEKRISVCALHPMAAHPAGFPSVIR